MYDFKYGDHLYSNYNFKMAPRIAYKVTFKLKAIKYADENGNIDAARKSEIHIFMIRKWKEVD